MVTKPQQFAQAAFTLTEIMIVVSIIGLLAAIAVPAYGKVRTCSARNQCISNLRRIDDAKAQWAMSSFKGLGAQPRDKELFGPTLYIRTKPDCPAGGEYHLNKIKELPTCSVPGHTLTP